MTQKFIFTTAFVVLVSCNKKLDVEYKQTHRNEILPEKFYKKGEEMSNRQNVLDTTIHKLELSYTVFGCACPNWIKKEDLEIDGDDLILDHYFYIEPQNPKLTLPHDFDAFNNNIKVVGQFYVNEDYPKGTIKGEEDLRKAKVFQYTDLKIVPK